MNSIHFLDEAGKTMKACLAILALAAVIAAPLAAADTGLLLDQSFSYTGSEDAPGIEGLEYSAILIPWLSMRLGTDTDLYLSASARGELADSEWAFAPELLRTELAWRVGNTGLQLKAGRLSYSDPLFFAARGLFDGMGLSFPIGDSRVNAAVLYSGLQYKKSASITMTERDLNAYYETLDYGNFWDTYFASRRVIVAADWEMLVAEKLRLNLALLGQFDANEGGKFHSQYLEGKARLPLRELVFNAAFCVSPQESVGLPDSAGNPVDEFRVAMAGDIGVDWMLPTAILGRLSFLARFSSGHTGDSIGAFVPISTIPQGNILKAKFSGISMLHLAYTARLHQTLSASVETSYFVLSDLGTYRTWPAGSDGYFLGNEFFGRLVYSPASDLQVQAGCGVFLPALGNAAPDEKPRWSVELTAVLAIY